MPDLSAPQPSLLQPDAGFAPAPGGPSNTATIGGQTVIFRAMEAFCHHPQIFAVQPVLNPDDTAIFNDAVSGLRHAAAGKWRRDAPGLGACRT